MRASEERPRPAIWGPVLIAAVFLAIIGASAGWVLGSRAAAADRRAAEEVLGGQLGGDSGRTPERGQKPRGGDTQDDTSGPGARPGFDDQAEGTDPGTGSDDPPSADTCPREMARHAKEAGAHGDLTLALYVRTNQSEVWICADGKHQLYYQGHRGKPGESLIEGQNALFLTDVVDNGDHYLATHTDGGNRTAYRVSRHELVIGSERQPVEYYAS